MVLDETSNNTFNLGTQCQILSQYFEWIFRWNILTRRKDKHALK